MGCSLCIFIKIVGSVFAMSPCALKLEGAPGETIVTIKAVNREDKRSRR